MINVAIADDHPLMLEGVKKVLNKHMDIQVTGEATTGGEVLDIVTGSTPDLLIMDIAMPGKSGLELLKDVRVMKPDLPILILSIHSPERFAVRCIKAGANGYISKSTITDELVKAVRRIVNEKRKYITPEVAQELASRANGNGRPLHESLSDREFEVLCEIANGLDVQEIAEKLLLSPHTIHTYRSRIKEKLNLSSDVEMARYALKNKLIQ